MSIFQHLTDRQLYKRCKAYGLYSRKWMRKFEGTLPEVNSRRLYKRRGYASIYEFAKKLAAMSEEKVNKILRLWNRLGTTPKLQKLFEEGEVGYSKLAAVAYIVTSENEKEWIDKIKTMSRYALEAYIHEIRKNEQNYRVESVPGDTFQPVKFTEIEIQNSDARFETPQRQIPQLQLAQTEALFTISQAVTDQFSQISISPSDFVNVNFKISRDEEFQLRLIKQKLEKQSGETLSLGQVLRELIKYYQGEQHGNKKINSREFAMQLCPECIARKRREQENKINDSQVKRYVPLEIRRLVLTRQNCKCAYPGCNLPGDDLHHIKPFAITRSHDPDKLIYLCNKHHNMIHELSPPMRV